MDQEQAAQPDDAHVPDVALAGALPLYDCHKQVYALKIKRIGYKSVPTPEAGPDAMGTQAILEFEDERFAPIEVSADYVAKHDPQAGGYFVIYMDGYRSWSPADAFETGYTAHTEPQPAKPPETNPPAISREINKSEIDKLCYAMRHSQFYGWSGLKGEERLGLALGFGSGEEFKRYLGE